MRMTPSRKKALLSMLREGRDHKEIASELELSRSTVQNYAKRLSRTERKQLSSEDLALMKDMLIKKVSVPEICKKLGVGKEIVYRHRDQWGIEKSPHGGRHLSAAQVKKVFSLYHDKGESRSQIAKRFGVTSGVIDGVLKGKTYREISVRLSKEYEEDKSSVHIQMSDLGPEIVRHLRKHHGVSADQEGLDFSVEEITIYFNKKGKE